MWLLFYGDPVTQLFEIARRNLFICGNPRFDLNQVAFRLTGLHQSLFGTTIFDHVNTADSRLSDNSSSRNQHRRLSTLL